MDQRNRRAPVALARDAPIAQPVLHALVAETFGFQRRGDRIDRRLKLAGRRTVPEFTVTPCSAYASLPGRDRVFIGAGRRRDHALDRQLVLRGELEVALVVGRHRHHRAFAVTHQHVVGDPHRELLAGERMHDEQAGRHAFLFLRRELGFHHGAALALLDERGELRIRLPPRVSPADARPLPRSRSRPSACRRAW